jgi:hypothetical protein
MSMAFMTAHRICFQVNRRSDGPFLTLLRVETSQERVRATLRCLVSILTEEEDGYGNGKA